MSVGLRAENFDIPHNDHGRTRKSDFSIFFSLEIPFLGKFGPKKSKLKFKLKFGTQTNSNMQNSMVVFTFFILDWKHTFWANLVQKIGTYNQSQNI